MHFYLHLNLGGMFYRSHSVYGMLILSLTGNRIRGTPILSLLYYYTHQTLKCKLFFNIFQKFLLFLSLSPTKNATMYALSVKNAPTKTRRSVSFSFRTCIHSFYFNAYMVYYFNNILFLSFTFSFKSSNDSVQAAYPSSDSIAK